MRSYIDSEYEISLAERIRDIGVLRLIAASIFGAACAFAVPWVLWIIPMAFGYDG